MRALAVVVAASVFVAASPAAWGADTGNFAADAPKDTGNFSADQPGGCKLIKSTPDPSNPKIVQDEFDCPGRLTEETVASPIYGERMSNALRDGFEVKASDLQAGVIFVQRGGTTLVCEVASDSVKTVAISNAECDQISGVNYRMAK